MTISSTATQSTSDLMSPTPTPCKYFISRFNSTHGPDACAYGVFAGAGALVVIACVLMCVGICCCYYKQQRKQKSERRIKSLVATQAASWFTSSLTSKLSCGISYYWTINYTFNLCIILESFNKQLANKQVPSKQNDYPDLPTTGR